MKLKNTIGAALLGAMAVLLGAGAQAQERWWPAAVKDMSGKAPVALQYQPGEKATKPWRICALFPHMKDTIWLAVNYGIVEEARRQGVAVTIYQAGGYENLPRQLSQFDDCMAAGFDALVVGAISEAGLARKFREAEKAGKPVIAVLNPVDKAPTASKVFADNVVMGGEESGGMSIHGHIPEGDGVLMGLLLLEVLAEAHKPLHVMVDELLAAYGPAQYARTDLKLSRPVPKAALTRKLVETAPDIISGVEIEEVRTSDGIKYYLADGSWLLIRPSGTEPVLRVYAEAPNDERVRALLDFGELIAAAEK